MKDVLIAVEAILDEMTLNEVVEERAYSMARTARRQRPDHSPEEIAAASIYLAQMTLLEEHTREQVIRHGGLDDESFHRARDFVADVTGVSVGARSPAQRLWSNLKHTYRLLRGDS